jgi:nitrite reductase/ring-hydroxylating ferredoxin subunit
VIRGSDGALRCFINLCRHRGAVLHDEGRGSARLVQCPYHAWSYDDRGRLTGVPHSGGSNIDRASHALDPVRLQVWRGIVFISFDAEAEPLDRRLAGLDRHLENFRYERYEQAPAMETESWAANWKLIVENAMDWYHLFQVHPKSLNPISPTRDSFNLEGSALWTVTASKLGTPAPKRPEDPPSLRDFEREHYFVASIPPNAVLFASADGLGWLSVLPQSAELTLVCGGGRFTKHEDGPAALELQNEEIVMREDRALCERLQKGMQTHHGRGGQLMEIDRPISDFHRYLGWRLFDHPLAEPWRSAI